MNSTKSFLKTVYNLLLMSLFTFVNANLLTNGNFSSGETGWGLSVYAGSATSSVVGGRYEVNMSSEGVNFWDINVHQLDVTLVQGQSYELTFTAASDSYRSISVGFDALAGTPHYGGFGYVSLSSTPKTFTTQFTMNNSTDNQAVLGFTCGNEAVDFWIDNVSLIAIDDIKPSVEITGGPTINTSDTRPTFTWSGTDDNSVSHYFCAIDRNPPDIKLTATSYTPAYDLSLGAHTFYVYAVDNTGQISEIAHRSFTVGNLQNDNILTNGDFSSGTTGWGLTVNTGSATGSIVNGGYEINITQDGTAFWHINLHQLDVTLVNGKTYELSFQAKADEYRSMSVGLDSFDGSTAYGGFGYVTLNSDVETYTVQFTMEHASVSDAVMGFTCGTDDADIWIDNVVLREVNQTVDNAPTVTITGGPTGSTSDKRPTFTWSGSDDNSVVYYFCEIDDDTPDYQTLLTTYQPGSELSEGAHTFYVYAVDNAGQSSIVASRSFTVESTVDNPPSVSIIAGPSGTTSDKRPTFVWEGTDDGSIIHYYCSIDDDTPNYQTTLTSYQPGTDLTNGSHTFYVYAVDNGGQSSPIASRSFVIDDGTEIIELDNISSDYIKEFIAGPNPATLSDEFIIFQLPSDLKGNGAITIFDNLGNILDDQSIYATGNQVFRWDMTDKYGNSVGTGTFIALLKVKKEDGTLIKKKIILGVKEI